MSNRTQLRAQLRAQLGDTGTNTVWSDVLLDVLLTASTTWYSRLWPVQATAYRDVAVGQRTFAAPPGAFDVVQVECPPGRVLPFEAEGSSGGTGQSGLRQSWSLWGN